MFVWARAWADDGTGRKVSEAFVVIPIVIVGTQGAVNAQRRQLTQISREEVGWGVGGGQREIPKGHDSQKEARVFLLLVSRRG